MCAEARKAGSFKHDQLEHDGQLCSDEKGHLCVSCQQMHIEVDAMCGLGWRRCGAAPWEPID